MNAGKTREARLSRERRSNTSGQHTGPWSAPTGPPWPCSPARSGAGCPQWRPGRERHRRCDPTSRLPGTPGCRPADARRQPALGVVAPRSGQQGVTGETGTRLCPVSWRPWRNPSNRRRLPKDPCDHPGDRRRTLPQSRIIRPLASSANTTYTSDGGQSCPVGGR